MSEREGQVREEGERARALMEEARTQQQKVLAQEAELERQR